MVEEVVKVTRNSQVTIPASIRSRLGIREGDFVRVVYEEGEGFVRIVPLKRRRTTIKVGRRISVEEVEEAVEEVLNEVTS
ncbi:MAG: AbrB family transcriptional regulator [Thermoprotei archaeon]|nr:MAG: AbrB family transcriptional regulator [Thermoprotei archaeon]